MIEPRLYLHLRAVVKNEHSASVSEYVDTFDGADELFYTRQITHGVYQMW